MEEEKKEVTTLVDSLFDLVKEKKEISIPEAAKLLHTEPKVVEQWALFLEEEGLVNVNYGLSAPTITYSGENDTLSETSQRKLKNGLNAEKVDVVSRIKELEERVKNVNVLSGELASWLINSLTDIFSMLASQYDDSKFISKLEEKKYFLMNLLNLVASGRASNFKARIARNTLLKNLEEIRNLLLDKIHSDEKNNIEQLKSTLKAEAKNGEVNMEIFSDIEYLLEQAQEFAKNGDLKKARELYKKISELKSKIPEIYYKKNLELVENIVDFDRQLIKNLKERAIKEFNFKEKQIMILLSQAKSYAARDKIEMAENSLKRATELFNELPVGFIERKTDLQNKILETKSRLLRIKSKVETKKFSLLESKLKSVIRKIEHLLQKKEVNEAKNLLSLAEKLVNMIPPDFYSEKKELNNELIELSHHLDRVSEKIQREKFAKEIDKLKSQIKVIEKAIKSGRTDFAINSYVEATSLFKHLPPGFIKEKIPIQEKLLELYSKINELILKEKIQRFSYDFKEIVTLIDKANEFIKINKLKEAQELYEKILKLYDNLPGGFLEKKTMLRLKILNLYDKLRERYNEMSEHLLSSLKLFPSPSSELEDKGLSLNFKNKDNLKNENKNKREKRRE